MRIMIPLILTFLVSFAAPIGAVSISEDAVWQMEGADVVLLGEFHDNPAHHVIQAELVARLQPAALVFEMLTKAQGELVTPGLRADKDALEQALGWAESGWPDFAMYHPIFSAAPAAQVFGAMVPRSAARAAMERGLADAFGAEAARFGLTTPLEDAEQALRERLQFEAHCEAMPAEILPGMVNIQRLRDARLAQAVVHALAQTGGPVVVITGNGHARGDWGVPRYLRRVIPDATLFVLGQSEGGVAPPGAFDAVIDAAPVDRPDPCEAFRK